MEIKDTQETPLAKRRDDTVIAVNPDTIVLNVAIVDDSEEDLDRCESLLLRFAHESRKEIRVNRFLHGEEFLAQFKAQFDILFLDVNLGLSNGIDVAKRVREVDESVVIIFVTNLSRYATEGYVVNALDYVLKPLSYESFYLKLNKAISNVANRANSSIVVPTKSGFTKLMLDSIHYVEVFSHDVVFHGDNGDVKTSGTLKAYEAKLRPYHFLRCNSCYLVNARKIERICKFEILLSNGETIEISHPKRKEFIQAFKNYIANAGGGTL